MDQLPKAGVNLHVNSATDYSETRDKHESQVINNQGSDEQLKVILESQDFDQDRQEKLHEEIKRSS